MSNKNIPEIYDKVYRQVYPQVKNIQRGFLYKVIQIILREEKSKKQEKTLKICNSFGIQPSDYIKDDYKTLNHLLEVVEENHPSLKKGKGTANFFRGVIEQISENDKMEEMRWIIIGACILVGLYFCLKYIEVVQQQKEDSKRRVPEDTGQLSPPNPIPAALCLVIPAKIASTLRPNSSLSASDVEYLIDSASYFLCTSPDKVQPNEKLLAETHESISPDSQQEVYIRIFLRDGGRDLIDKKVPYILKTNLPNNEKFVVEKWAGLKNLSGLEEFNRI